MILLVLVILMDGLSLLTSSRVPRVIGGLVLVAMACRGLLG